jgi:predicted permease
MLSLDLRAAVRQLVRAPALAVAAIVTLAVGVGTTTAVFSFVSAVMAAATPAPDMDRLVGVWTQNRGEAETKGLATPADAIEWSRRARSLAAIAAWRPATFNVSGLGPAVRDSAQLVTPPYFTVFGWQPILGRAFTDADARAGAPRVVLLSHAYWRNRLSARADILGRTMYLDREPATIIGVLPELPGVTNFFLPLRLDELRGDHAARTLFVFARLGNGVSIEQARDEMRGIGAELAREWPDTHRGWSAGVAPLQEEFVGPQARLVFGLLIAIVSTVLIIGCVNIANLLLARGVARRGEMAVRVALGAAGWRLARQLFVECGLLALIGGALSLVVSRWTLQVLASLGSIDSPWLASGGTNPRVLALTAFVAMLATIVAGVVPALAVRKLDVVEGIRSSARANIASARRTTRILVGAQVALAVTLLVVAGLATRTLIALESLEPGFDIDNVLTASVTLPADTGQAAATQWSQRALTELRRVPGVVSAGATTRLPFAGTRWNPNRGLVIEGQAARTGDENRWAVDYSISPGLLESLRVPLRAGRTFTDADGAGAPLVAIRSEERRVGKKGPSKGK